MNERLAYTVAEAAELLQVTERTVRQLISSGKLVARQCGTERGIRIGRNAIEAFLLEPDESLIAEPGPEAPCRKKCSNPSVSKRTLSPLSAPSRGRTK